MNFLRSPIVTVYIANHNYGKYVEQSIESVLKQTFVDFELIIIDDGSTDGSHEIIKKYDGIDRIRVILQRNKGLNVTNNIALRASRGKYIMRLDADDYLDENALNILSGLLERNPEIGMVFPDFFLVDPLGRVLEVVRRHNFNEVGLLDQPAHGACTMIRRDCLLKMAGYDESFKCQDGYDLWLRFIRHFRVTNVNLPLFYYRQHPKSLTRNENRILTTRSQILKREAIQNGRCLTCLAVIPVRGCGMESDSSALKMLGGAPLIDWTIRACLDAQRISDVIVTTPDANILEHLKAFENDRIFPIKRDRELAMPNTYIEDTVFNALARYTRAKPLPDAICVLYIECPFRDAQFIDTAVDLMEVFAVDSVIGVRPETDEFYRHNGNGLKPLRKGSLLRLERSDIYRCAGQLYAVRREFFEKERKLVGGRIGHVTLDQLASMRIKTDLDWCIAESQADLVLSRNQMP